MADVVALGGGPAGLASAMLLAQQGLDVVVLDREGSPPADPETAWESWEKKSVGQFRLVHFLQPAGRQLLRRPPLRVQRLQAVGVFEVQSRRAAVRQLPGGASDDLDLRRFETLTTCRRPLIDYAFQAAGARRRASTFATAVLPRPSSPAPR